MKRYFNKLAAATAVLGVALTAFSGGLSASTPPAAPGADGQVQLPAAASGDWWAQVQRNIAASEYHATWQEHTLLKDGAAAWQAANRAHNLRSYFTPDGVRVIPRDSEATPAWRWGLELLAAGWAGQAESVARAEIQTDGGRVEYRRGALTEWYINNEKGLEQGFTFLQAPAGDGETLEMQIKLHGTLDALFHADAQRIDFTTADGVLAIEFGKLLAWDADGRDLPAGFSLADGVLSIQVAAKDARYPVIVDPLASSAAWTAESNQVGAALGGSVASAGDVNNDGYDDVIVGAPVYDSGNTDTGSVWVYHGSAAGLSATAAWVKQVSQANARFGSSVASAGDVNNDGFADVIIGAPYYTQTQTNEGKAFVYLGSASGLGDSPVWTMRSYESGARFGHSVASAGDVNNDGYADVIVGAPLYGNGKVFLYLGIGTSGLNNVPAHAWSGTGGEDDEQFGWSVASAGDVNGDGYDDVIVGSPRYDYDGGAVWRGRAVVYLGKSSGLHSYFSWSSNEANSQYANFGWSVASAGDVNGDGYADIIVGAPGYDTEKGKAFVYLGSASGLSTAADWSKAGDHSAAFFGRSVASAGDVNGDGYAEVIIGAPTYSFADLDHKGAAYVYYGSTAGLGSAPGWSLASNQDDVYFGSSVASAGDVNGDSYADFIVGAPQYSNGESLEGGVFVYYGDENNPPAATNVGISGNWTEGGILTGNYTYSDEEGGPDNSTYRWRHADDDAGTNTANISNAINYTIASADVGKYLSFCVIPNDGMDTSPKVCSDWGFVVPPPPPPEVVDALEITNIAAGGMHTCVLTKDETVKCWGRNVSGQLGNNSTNNSSEPVDVSDLSGVIAITAGYRHTCALTNAGQVECWGRNVSGQLGDGSTSNRNKPVAVSGLSDVKAIAAGYEHTCALTNAGEVKCWGDNSAYQLGDASIEDESEWKSTVPVSVPGLSGIQAIAAGHYYTCALTDAKKVRCWGVNGPVVPPYHPDVGDEPMPIYGLSGVTVITTSEEHACALNDQSLVKCWGDNTYGQIGDGSTNYRDDPVDVSDLVTVKAIAAGKDHTCALTGAGEAKCWGRNHSGQLGDGSIVDRGAPVTVADLSGVTAIAAGGSHTCAMIAGDRVKCWGRNTYGQLGNGTSGSGNYSATLVGVIGVGDEPPAAANVAISGTLREGRPLTGNYDYSDAENDPENGSSYRWQRADSNSGTGAADISGADTSTYTTVAADSGKYLSFCVTPRNGVAIGIEVCSSWNAIAANQAPVASRVTITGTLQEGQSLTGGYIYSDPDSDPESGSTYRWQRADSNSGTGTAGIRGADTSAYTPVAADVNKYLSFCITPSDGVNVGSEACSAWFLVDSANSAPVASRVTITGTLREGQSLTGAYTYSDPDNDPESGSTFRWQRAVSGLGVGAETITSGATNYTATSADAGKYLSFCVTPSDGIGTGSEACSSWSGPVSIDPTNGGKADNIATLTTHTCALDASGAAKCWGNNSYGQLGDGSTVNSSTPMSVTLQSGRSLSGMTALAAGKSHSCALGEAGEVWCWGINYAGQLGDGSGTEQHAPVAVSGLSGMTVTTIAAGNNHTCALTRSGEVWCWGRNNHGQLGNGTTANSLVPIQVSDLSGVTAIGVGPAHNCALLDNGEVWCWGYNPNGQLGNGGTTDSTVPVGVSGLSGVTAIAIAVGRDHTCALLDSGSAKCWGRNIVGQLGNGSATDSTVPVSVSNLSGATLIAAGSGHTCALISDGTVQCWGNNGNGQLGNNTTDNQVTPVNVSNLSGVAALAGSYTHTCALLDSGGVKCWGKNDVGQLGNGTTSTTDSLVPVDVVMQ